MLTEVVERELHGGGVGVAQRGYACLVRVQSHHHAAHEIDLHQKVVSAHAAG